MNGKDTILAKVCRGEVLSDIPVIDVHVHIFSYEALGAPTGSGGYGAKDTQWGYITLKGMIERMDRLGIDKVCAFGSYETLRKVVMAYPGRFLPHITLSHVKILEIVREWLNLPTCALQKSSEAYLEYVYFRGDSFVPSKAPQYRFLGSVEDLGAYLQRGYKMGCRGIKIWDTGLPQPLNNFYRSIFEFADEHGLIMLCHNWGEDSRLEEVAKQYPNAIFIEGHMSGALRMISPLKRRDNVYASTTSSYWPYHLEKVVDAVGAEKLVAGSDAFGANMAMMIGTIAFADIRDQDKKKILGLNMKRILTDRGFWHTWGY